VNDDIRDNGVPIGFALDKRAVEIVCNKLSGNSTGYHLLTRLAEHCFRLHGTEWKYKFRGWMLSHTSSLYDPYPDMKGYHHRGFLYTAAPYSQSIPIYASGNQKELCKISIEVQDD
jgi:hypothetical protein